MGPAFYVMAILGCGDGEAACRQVRLIGTHYATADACTAATATRLGENGDIDYPVVTAECRPVTRRMAAVETGTGG